jgi:ABC-type sugar transport system ATPase subunit
MNFVSPSVVGVSRDGVIAGVRPEHVHIGAGDLPARVELVERTGHETLWHLRVEATALVARGPARTVAPGTTVGLGIDATGVRLFAADTGEAVE